MIIYKCEKCSHVWQVQKPGPVKNGCPVCKHDYIKWVNFDQWQKDYDQWQKDYEQAQGRLTL